MLSGVIFSPGLGLLVEEAFTEVVSGFRLQPVIHIVDIKENPMNRKGFIFLMAMRFSVG